MLNKFFNAVWSRQDPEGEYAFTSTKNWETGAWADYPHHVGDLVDAAYDLYFAPCLFSGDRRLRRDACGGRWLYADLDEVDPRALATLAVAPTLAWETSPGRYQAMWLLDRLVAPRSLEKLNQRMTYYTGADKGGWSLTKVLRVPGTVSTKRDDPFTVRLLKMPKVKHKYADLNTLLKDVDVSGSNATGSANRRPEARDLPDRDSVLRRKRRRLSVRARQLLRSTEAIGSDDRSRRLWELEYELLESGLSPAECLSVVRHTPWNKYAGQRRELDALWKEIQRQSANRATGPKPTRAQKRRAEKLTAEDTFSPVGFRDFVTSALPRTTWLVEGVWSGKAHGLLGGESKSFKSLLTYDLAVSVATATPFLGRFAVPKAGPVLIIQEENTPGDTRDAILRIATSRGFGPTVVPDLNDPGRTELHMGDDLPVELINNAGFSLVDENHMRWLESYVRRVRPVLVVLDPLYLITPGVNEDSAEAMTPILARLLRIKQKYGCGIMIVHHYTKSKEHKSHRAAERMSGTGVFHRWLASAVYVERPDESLPTVRLSGEHRSKASAGAFSVTFDLGTDEDLHYSAEVGPWVDKKPDKERTEELFDLGVSVQITGDKVVKIPEISGPTMIHKLARGSGYTSKELAMAYRMENYVVRADGPPVAGSNGSSKNYLMVYPKGME